jgi:hypothetical protein
MTVYPRGEVAGGRKAPRHEIAGCGRQRCRGRYGDFAAGCGARVMQRGSSETHLASSHGHDWERERAAGALRDEVLRLLAVMTQQSDVAT